MGSFDDIPTATGGGSFDDLPDLIQAAPGKQKVGAGSAFGRAAMEGYAGTGNLLGMAGGGLATILEGAFNLATGNDSTKLRDAVFEHVVEPTRSAQKYWAVDPATEELDGGGAEAAAVAGSLASLLQQAVAQPGAAAGAMVPKLLYPAMRAAPAVVQKIAPLAAEGAIKAQLPFAQPMALDRTQDLMDQGVDQGTAIGAGATNLLGNTVMGALPLAKAGGLLTRAGTGAAMNVPTGMATRGAEAAVLGDEYAKQAQPMMGEKEVGMDAGIGAVMAALFGPRAAAARRAPIAEPAPTIDLAVQAADLEKYGAILQANGIDPTSQRAAGVMANLKAREARKAQPTEDALPPSPEELALANKQQTPATIAVDSQGRADVGDTGVKAGVMSAEGTKANVEADARGAFDIAARRQGQVDADLANRNEIDPDYQGRGAAARGGRFDGGVREVTLYGERPVTVMESGVGKSGDQTIIGYEGEDGQIHQQAVPTKDLKTFNVPENQRLAQDFTERSSTPPKGVGVETMAGEKMPRRSTDRIAGDEVGGSTTPYNPKPNDRGQVDGDVLPPAGPGPGGPVAPRQGRVIEGELSGVDFRDQGDQQALPGNNPREPATKLPPIAERPGAHPNQEPRSARPVAESQAPAPKAGDDGVAPIPDGAVPDPAPAARPAEPVAQQTPTNDAPTPPPAEAPPAKPKTKAQIKAEEKAAADEAKAKKAADEQAEFDRVQAAKDREEAAKKEAARVKRAADKAETKAKAAAIAEEVKSYPAAVVERIKALIGEAGWAERGGRLLRDEGEEGNVIGRTAWVPAHEWWGAKPSTLTEANIGRIVADGMDGKLTRKGDLLAFEYLRDVAKADVEAQAEALRQEDLAQNAKNEEVANVIAEHSALHGDDATGDLYGKYSDSYGFDSDGFLAEARRQNEQARENEQRARGEAVEGGQGAEQGAAGATPEAGGAGANGRGGDEGGRGREDFDLEQPTPDGLRAADEQRVAADKAKADAEAAAEAKAKADAEVPDFQLLGSNRKADANPNQSDLLADGNELRDSLDRPNGAGTLHSNPVGEVVKFLGRVSGFTNPEYQADFKSQVKVMVEAIRSIGKPKETAENFFAAVARIVGFANQGRLQALGHVFKSKAIEEIRLLIDTDAGRGTGHGEVYGQGVERNTKKFGSALFKAVDKLSKAEVEQVAKLMQNPRNVKPGTPLHDAAAKLSKLMADVHAYEREAGVDIGEVKDGYFPRIDNVNAIMSDQAGYKAALILAYQKTDPSISLEAATEAANVRYRAVALAGVGAVDNPLVNAAHSAPSQNSTKGRTLSKEADEIMRPYLIQNPLEALHTRIHQAVRRAEFERRFGGEGRKDGKPLPKEFERTRDALMKAGKSRAEAVEKAAAEYNKSHPNDRMQIGSKLDAILGRLEAEGNAKAQGAVIDALRSSLGELPAPNTGRHLRTFTSYMQALVVLRYLRHAAVTSVSEPALVAGVTGNPLDVGRAYMDTIADISRRVGKKFLGDDWMKGTSIEQAHEIAEMLGVVGFHAEQMSAILQQAGGVSEGSKFASKMANRAVYYSGLRSFTDATRVSITNIGMSFMRSLAKGAARGEKLAVFNFKDFGVPEADIPEFIKYIQGEGGVTAKKLSDGTNKRMAELYAQTLLNIVDKVIMAPKASERPYFANHPVGRVAYSLMSYLYSFQQNYLNRAYRMAKVSWKNEQGFAASERVRLLAPALGLSLAALIQYAMLPVRSALFGEDDEKKKKPKTDGQKIFEAISRSGAAGALDPLYNMALSAKYERDPATMLLGPVGGDYGKLLMDVAKYPTDRNSDNTNTHERQLAKDFYACFVDPALSVAAINLLPGPTAVVATQALGHKSVREAFITAMAGKSQKKDQPR